MRKIENILEERPREALENFLIEYRETQELKNMRWMAREDIQTLIKYYRGTVEQREVLRSLISMENQWYDALDKGKIDYSIYNDRYYFFDLWACWIVYSRGYLRGIIKLDIMDELRTCKSIIDLGCGISYTTAALTQMFPDAEIYGTNLSNTQQWLFCKEMAKKYNFKMIENISQIDHKIDLVFASEYFEHIENCVDHLEDIIIQLEPKYLIIANAFNTRSVGHFYKYKHEGIEIEQEYMSRLFNKTLDEMGYFKLKTRLWNNRPNMWQRKK